MIAMALAVTFKVAINLPPKDTVTGLPLLAKDAKD